ncbi:hypothetical protein IQ260_06680 [Leptolyngbya cf. ectocarpi LEGE 11479]|uniref:Uncharacterized protein n=1 Tax=Leptolyngbya cf. ectocarpi LEGE 11479 TaxID=1828722 RepID=A0A928X2F6_LEPEC|nr:hypothetical protein [Leptolyngbya ectocarpi]MBE9066334.1 hypothetical protein [Leptolyngbya cf. ectocarpi LEGE 11479]
MEKRFVREIRKLDDTQRQFEDKSRARPSGLVYDPRVDQFLYLRESSGNATTTVLDAVTAYEDRDLSRSVTLPTGIESLNTTFDARFNRFLGLSRNGNTLILVQSDANSRLDTSTQTEVDIRAFGIKNARGFTTAPDGTLYVLDGAAKAIIVLKPDARGNFEQSNISQVALPSEVGNNLRGIAFDATTGNLHVLSIPKQDLFELTPKGDVVAVRDLSPFKFGKPESLVFGFSGDNTDDPNELSLYVADSERGVTELSFEQPVRPQVSASLPFVQSIRVVAPVAAEPPLLEADAFVSSFVQRTDTSQWSPPSPDPSGVTFDSASGNLVLDDGEVNEIAIFQGVNVWEFTTSGTVVDTGNTLDFPTGGVEPTGISYNPANGHFFFSNDLSGDVITETDGNGSAGDVPGGVVNQFNSSSGGSGSTDSEGVAFADLPGGPFLFIAGGINGEVYQFTLSGTLVNQFDTAGDGFTDPEGIVYDSVTGNLFITGGDPVVGEYTTTGTLVNTYDISTSPTIDRPAGIVIAPSSQGGGGRSFYIVDRGEDSDAGNIQNDGQVHEFSIAAPAPSGNLLYVSSTSGGNVAGIAFEDEDILIFDDGPGSWSMFFDGSDVGLGASGVEVDAFHLNSDGSLLLSLTTPATLPNIGAIDDSDIVRFIPTATGNNTAGSYELFFDGSDVGLDTNGEDIDSIGLTAGGDLVIGTSGSFSVSGLSGKDEDLLVFTDTSLGANTSGTWALYFDGSDVGLNNNGNEDVNGTWIDPNGDIYLSTKGAFSVSGASGDGADIFRCALGSTGANTSCTFDIFWDGSTNGFSGGIINAFALDLL